MTMSTPRLSEQLCFALYSASNSITSIYRPILSELDLTYPQFVVLMCLWEQDNVPIKNITRRTSLNKATMSPLLKRLEEKGLVVRKILKDNERQKNISLTPKGLNLSARGEAITQEVFCATGLSKTDAELMISLCSKINLMVSNDTT